MLGLRTAVPLLATAILLVVPAEATTSYYQGSAGETAFNAAIGGLTLMDPSLTFSATSGPAASLTPMAPASIFWDSMI